MAAKLGTGPVGTPYRPANVSPIERRQNIWVLIARHFAHKAVGYSTRALEAHPHRPDPYEQDEILERKMVRDEERLRRQEERRLQAKEDAQSPGAPWIYMPGLMKEGSAGRERRRLEKRPKVSVRTGGTPAWVIWIQVLLVLSLLSIPALALEPSEMLADPGLEKRAREISLDLRCLVCQNQSIDDSNATLAQDLRRLVRERLVAGDSNREVLAYVTGRYGDFVLLRPPFQSNTYVLWLGPAAVFLLGVGGVLLFFRSRRRSTAQEAPLTAEEQQKFAEVLAAGSGARR